MRNTGGRAHWGCAWIVSCLVLGLLAATASAQTVRPQPETEIRYQSLTAARVNPLGLVSILDLTGRFRLYQHDSAILTQNYVGIGMTAVAPGAPLPHRR
jgi:hypothetical protein